MKGSINTRCVSRVFAEKQHLKMGLFGIMGVFQGIFVFSQSALKAKSLITDRFIFST